MSLRLCLTVICSTLLTTAVQADEWVSIFDGSTINGWVQHNGIASYRIEEGAIVGRTAEGSPNSFLCTAKDYGNFDLEFEVKCDVGLNSGVQIRSAQKAKDGSEKKNDKKGRVFGPQVEIETSGEKGAEAGYVYGEATGLGWLTSKDNLQPHKHFKDGEWNRFRILAEGPRIQTWINGNQVSDLTHEEIYKTHPKGFIGLQVHGIGKEKGPFEVAWRNIRIRELK